MVGVVTMRVAGMPCAARAARKVWSTCSLFTTVKAKTPQLHPHAHRCHFRRRADPFSARLSATTNPRNGKVYSGSATEIVLQATRVSANGAQTCVPYNVKQSSSTCVANVAKKKPAHPAYPTSFRRLRASGHASTSAPTTQNSTECVMPRWNARFANGSSTSPPSTSKSGIVPPIAPQTSALFPMRRPRTASPVAAPSTIWDSESMPK